MIVKTREQLLPSRSTDRACVFAVGAVQLELAWVAEGLWQIGERLGSTWVQHGRLHRRSAHYEVTTANGIQARANTWERAVRLHLGSHGP